MRKAVVEHVYRGVVGMNDVMVAVGTRKGLWLLRSADRRTWTVDGPHLLMKSVAACAIDARGSRVRVLAGASYDHWGPAVSWSDDLGGTWHEAADGSGIRFPADLGASVESVWQIRPDTEGRPGVVWAGTEPSALWRSDDGGQTFKLVEGLWNHPHRPTWEPGGGGQALHTILPHPMDDARLMVAMSTGGVYVSHDAGETWSPSNTGITADFLPGEAPEYGQCVHKVVRDATDPEKLFLQNHPGVFRSDDGGKSWVSIADDLPSSFGFPIVSHPYQPDKAWMVPLTADIERLPPNQILQVWRTSDGGASWRGSAVSQPGFYGSVLRDAMSVDDVEESVGVYVGTRDGTLYASADEGRTWTEVLAHLPDILCVRAATLP